MSPTPARSSRRSPNASLPGGPLILYAPIRAAGSKLLTITLAEGLGRIPRGTHHYDEFITPKK